MANAWDFRGWTLLATETRACHADGPRDMWGWRDAIVDAYNQNMPFDQFSIAQLAGDLIPDATQQQKILAGFNRNNGTTDEGVHLLRSTVLNMPLIA